jgi:hypothetical protein
MPKDVEMRFTIPDELGPNEEVLAELRERVRAVENWSGPHFHLPPTPLPGSTSETPVCFTYVLRNPKRSQISFVYWMRNICVSSCHLWCCWW